MPRRTPLLKIPDKQPEEIPSPKTIDQNRSASIRESQFRPIDSIIFSFLRLSASDGTKVYEFTAFLVTRQGLCPQPNWTVDTKLLNARTHFLLILAANIPNRRQQRQSRGIHDCLRPSVLRRIRFSSQMTHFAFLCLETRSL